ncbi:glycosyltransferase family 39 protein, partial [Candidatus Woesearchaeota archaeon]|nr:glycosyltransferase family 39 protein [Candidatus Woesearchaeota archaeon]
MKKDWYLIAAVCIALLSRLIFAFSWHEVWWDAGVYIGMGKYLFSLGQSGLWEHIRPPLLPVFLGLFWLLGSPVILGRLFEALLMAGIVFFVYDLSRKWFDRRVALIASLLVCFSPIFLYLSFHLYTEIPAVFLALFSLWLFERKSYFWSGFLLGLAFLTKFPAGIFLPIFAVFLFRKWKSLFHLLIGFALPVFPYMVVSWLAYGSPVEFCRAASDAIGRALGCNVLRYHEWYYYFGLLWNSEIQFSVLALAGIAALFLKRIKARYFILACLFLPLLYFMQLHCRDYRYLALFYPFIAMLAALGFIYLFSFLKGRWFIVIALLLAVWFAFVGFQFYFGNEVQSPGVAEDYFTYLQGKNISGEVWISNPVVAAYTDAKLSKVYYPIYDEGVSRQ